MADIVRCANRVNSFREPARRLSRFKELLPTVLETSQALPVDICLQWTSDLLWTSANLRSAYSHTPTSRLHFSKSSI